MLTRILLAAIVCTMVAQPARAQTRQLLDPALSQWQTYLGYPNPETPVPGLPRRADHSYAEPVGYNKDPLNVFSTQEQDGETVLRISGEIYGGIFTREDFANYHLTLEFKWGQQKWPPRLELALDSGILYHGTGEHGVDYWRAWPLSQEFQIIEASAEGTTGDWWKIAHSQINIRCARPAPDGPYRYQPTNPALTFGGEDGADITCRAKDNYEKSAGEWNRLELITFEDKSLHIVNGEVVMALSGSVYPENGETHPLTKGRIVLQSEAGEIFYRRIELQPLQALPEAYRQHF